MAPAAALPAANPNRPTATLSPPSTPSAIQAAKQKTASDPLNWRGFNELGLAYTRTRLYDDAIAAFEQALALHPVTTTLETERKQQAAIDAQHAAETEERRRIQQYQKDAQDAASMNMLFSSLLGSIASMPGASSDGLAMLPTLDTVSKISGQPGLPAPVTLPKTVLDSSLKPKQEIAGIYFNLGVAHFGKGNYSHAVQSLDNSLSFDPSRVEALWWEAEASFKQGNYQKSILMMNRYLALGNVSSPAPCFLRLAESFQALRLEKDARRAFLTAVEEYKNRIAAAPDDMDLVRELAFAYTRQDCYADAERTIQSLLTARESAESFLDLATLQILQSRYTDALQNIQKALTLKDTCRDLSRAWYLAGRAHDELGTPAESQEEYRKAAAILDNLPAGSQSPAHASVVYAAVGRYEEARKDIEVDLDRDPLGPEAAIHLFRLGLVCEKGGQDVDAMEALNRSLSLRPRYTHAAAVLNRLAQKNRIVCQQAMTEAESAAAQNNPARAIAQWTIAFQRMPAGLQKQQLLQKILQQAGSMDSPPPLTLEAQRHYLRGNAALKTAREPVDLDRAISEFQWAATYSPWVANIYLNASAASGVRLRYGRAIESLKLFLTASPKVKNVEDVLAKLAELEYQQEETLRSLSNRAN